MNQLRTLQAYISGLFQKSLVRNTLWMLLSQGFKLFIQAGYFVIIARTLGSEQYGAFAGVTALAGVVSPFSSFGTDILLIKNVSRNRGLFSECWGNTLFMILGSGVLLTALVLLGARFILPSQISLIFAFCICLSELIFLKIVDAAGKAFMAVDLMSRTAQLNILLSIKNFLAALVLIAFFQSPTVLDWAILYLMGTAVAALVSVLLIYRMLGSPKLALHRIRPEMAEGFYFAINHSAQSIYGEIDKTMLTRMASLEATGIYAAAYRLIGVAFVPVQSLLAAAYAKFFQQGASGVSGSLRLAKRLTPFAGAYGAIAGIGLFLFAPVIPYILGDEYASAVDALRWLSPMLMLRSLLYFAADTLTGAGFQGLRCILQIGFAIFNVLVNLWLIPLFSWRGAAWATLASEVLLTASLWWLAVSLSRREVSTS